MNPKQAKQLKVIGIVTLSAFFILIYAAYSKSYAPSKMKIWGSVSQQNGLAISGYDPVTYFTYNRAILGEDEFTLKQDGLTWKFISEEHKIMFQALPKKYTPQYGGFCAKWLSSGFTSMGDPEYWLKENDKVYLFASEQARDDFESKIPEGIIQKADEHWF